MAEAIVDECGYTDEEEGQKAAVGGEIATI